MTNEEAIRLLKAMMNEMILVFDRDRKKALNMAIEALKKQIPKKPTLHKGWLYCPVCGKDVLMEGYKFCPDCGQRIDWSEEG